jgi:hypothetical protein
MSADFLVPESLDEDESSSSSSAYDTFASYICQLQQKLDDELEVPPVDIEVDKIQWHIEKQVREFGARNETFYPYLIDPAIFDKVEDKLFRMEITIEVQERGLMLYWDSYL